MLLGQQAFGLAARFIEKAFSLPRLVRFGTQQRQMRKRRQPRSAALTEGLLGKGEITLLGQLHQ